MSAFRRSLAVVGCFILLLFLGLLWIVSEQSSDQDGANVVQRIRSQRDVSSYDASLERALSEGRKAKKERNPAKGSYKLSKDEAEMFLSKRGRNVASLLFVICCTHDPAYINQIKLLPASPERDLVLLLHSKSDADKLAYATAFFEAAPENKLGGLMLARAMLNSGMDAEANGLLGRISSLTKISSFQAELLNEFTAAREVFGQERGFELLESHGNYWTVNLSRQYLGMYLDSLNFEELVKDGNTNIEELRNVAGGFLSRIGISKHLLDQEALLEMRDWISYNAKTTPTPGLDKLLKRVNEDLNSSLIGNIKNDTEFNRMSDERRWNFLLEAYAQ